MKSALRSAIALFLFTFGMAFFTGANAQFTTPNQNLTLTLSDLVEISGGVVTEDEKRVFD